MLANPAACMAVIRKSPEPSPVNTRPVRFAPCAAGARPSTRTRAPGSPKPGNGRPQYSSSRCAAFFVRATPVMYVRSRAQIAQLVHDHAPHLAKPHHQAGLRENPRRESACAREDLQRAIVAAAGPRRAVEPRHRLDVVIEDVRTGVEHGAKRRLVSLE